MIPAQHNHPQAFTLVEMVIASAIMGIIMTGLASAILIASHALPDDTGRAEVAADSAATADELAEELRSAIWITEHSATAVSFTVPDRDGDGLPERIRYAWSGTAGEPLTRQYNGAAAVNVLDDVRELALSYEVESTTEEYPGLPIVSAETLLSNYTNFWNTGDFKIDTSHWVGQYFTPASLPGNAVSWAVTRAVFAAKREDNGNDLTWVQLRPADASKLPTTTVLEQYPMYEGTLGSGYAWQTFSFSNAAGLSPSQGLCLVLQHCGSGGPSAKIDYEKTFGLGRVDTDHAGSSWSYSSSMALYHYIYGTYSTPGPPQTASRYYVTDVGITLRAGDDASARAVTAVQTLNTPELLSGLWQAYFNSDPTLDHNGDGVGDWRVHTGGTFAAGSLSGGVWDGSTRLDSSPSSDFAGLTTVNVCFRDTSADATGALLAINADWSGGKCAVLLAQIVLQPNDTQTLTVWCQQADLTLKTLAVVAGLPKTFVTLRLLIDPSLNTVNIKVAGADQGTQSYTTITPVNADHFATIYKAGGTAGFDYVTIRVSE